MTLKQHEQATVDLMDRLYAERHPKARGILDLIQELHIDIYGNVKGIQFRNRVALLATMLETEMKTGTVTLRQLHDQNIRLGLV